MSQPDGLVPFAPVSPSQYWRIRSWTFEDIPRRSGGPRRGLHITFEHIRDNRDAIRVEVYVDRTQGLDTLLPFLDAARDMPGGLRLEAHVLESASWDVIKAPRRRPVEYDDPIARKVPDVEFLGDDS